MSLQRKWFLFLSLFYSMIVIGLSALFINLNKNSISDAAIEKYKHFALYLAQNIAEYEYMANPATVERAIIADLKNDESVLFFFFVDNAQNLKYSLSDNEKLSDFVDDTFDNILLTDKLNLIRNASPDSKFEIRDSILKKNINKENHRSLNQGDEIFEIRQEVRYENNLLGIFRMGLAKSDLSKTILNQIKLIFVIDVFVLLLGLIAIYYFTLNLLKPVQVMTKSLNQLFSNTRDNIEESLKEFYPENLNDSTLEMKLISEAFTSFKLNLLSSFKKIHELNELQISKEKVDSMISTVQMLAHDLRRPFALLKTLFLTSNTENSISISLKNKNEISASIDHLDNLLNDMLDFSKSAILLKPHNLKEVVTSSLIQYQTTLNSKNISIELDISNEISVLCDASKLARIFNNIISNSIEAISEIGKLNSGKIKITAFDLNPYSDKKKIEISVFNSGPQINSDDLSKIFNLFFSKGKSKGTGLGLAIVKQFVHLHGGEITVKNIREPTKNGVEFSFQLEATENSALIQSDQTNLISANSESYKKNKIIDPDFKKIKPYRILILENEELFSDSLKDQLLNLNSSSIVQVVKNLKEANDLFSKNSFDLIFVDLELDNAESGFDFIEYFLNLNPLQNFYIYSNKNTSSLPDRLRTKLIQKPIDTETLKLIIGTLN